MPPPPGNNPAPPAPQWASPPPIGGAGPVGFLIDDSTNARFDVDRTIVLGSNPGTDPEVTIGQASMIRVDDPGIDEVQVRIQINGPAVTAEDVAGGGSWLSAPGQPASPLGLIAQQLHDGSQIRLGEKTFTFRAGPGWVT